MKRFVRFVRKAYNSDIATIIKVVIMLVAVFVYLLNVNLSTAPEFIYNQF